MFPCKKAANITITIVVVFGKLGNVLQFFLACHMQFYAPANYVPANSVPANYVHFTNVAA